MSIQNRTAKYVSSDEKAEILGKLLKHCNMAGSGEVCWGTLNLVFLFYPFQAYTIYIFLKWEGLSTSLLRTDFIHMQKGMEVTTTKNS